MTSTDQREPSAFPRVDLPPAYHQLVRQALVREAAARRRRHLAARRMVPLLAGIVVLVAGMVQVIGPSTVLAPVARLLGITPDGCGASREISPRAAKGVRYLVTAQPGWQVASTAVQTRVCTTPLGPETPIPYASWNYANPVGSWVRTGPDGTLTASVTLWRGLPPGVSEAVADRISKRAPTDQGDPGTVLAPPYRAVQVRGTTATEVGNPVGSLIWSEPDGVRWSLTSTGMSPAQLRDIAGGLALTGTYSAISGAAGGDLQPLAVPPQPDVPARQWVTHFVACYHRPGDGTDCRVRLDVRQNDLPWQVRPVGRLVYVNGRTPALLSGTGTGASLMWRPASGVQATLSGLGLTTADLLAIAGTLSPVPADDPRLHAVWRP